MQESKVECVVAIINTATGKGGPLSGLIHLFEEGDKWRGDINIACGTEIFRSVLPDGNHLNPDYSFAARLEDGRVGMFKIIEYTMTEGGSDIDNEIIEMKVVGLPPGFRTSGSNPTVSRMD